MAFRSRIDSKRILISLCQPSKVAVLLAIACLAWVGILSLAFVFLLGAAITTGWIIAGALVLAMAVWFIVMMREIRKAVEWPYYLVVGRRGESVEEGGGSTLDRPRSGKAELLANRMFARRRGLVSGRTGGSHPRKSRSRRAALPQP